MTLCDNSTCQLRDKCKRFSKKIIGSQEVKRFEPTLVKLSEKKEPWFWFCTFQRQI